MSYRIWTDKTGRVWLVGLVNVDVRAIDGAERRTRSVLSFRHEATRYEAQCRPIGHPAELTELELDELLGDAKLVK